MEQVTIKSLDRADNQDQHADATKSTTTLVAPINVLIAHSDNWDKTIKPAKMEDVLQLVKHVTNKVVSNLEENNATDVQPVNQDKQS